VGDNFGLEPLEDDLTKIAGEAVAAVACGTDGKTPGGGEAPHASQATPPKSFGPRERGFPIRRLPAELSKFLSNFPVSARFAGKFDSTR
jgi:hypothetical protein